MLQLPKNIEKIDSRLSKKITLTTYDNVENETKDFVRRSGLRMKAGNWMNGDKPRDKYLSGDVGNFKILEDVQASSLFTPFFEKVVVSPDSKIVVIGDLHGNIETFISILEKLRQEGYLNEQYIIIHPNFYFVFLGDYTNKKPHSVETMLLLFHLYEQNIGSVFLLRGNHEYAAENKSFYEKYDFVNNYYDTEAPETLIGELARKFGVYYYPDLLYWYDYLPLTCYIGCSNGNNGNNFIQFCHSGLEIGFAPNDFLGDTSCRFKKLTQLNRYDAIQDILNNKDLSFLHNRVKFIFESVSDPSLKRVLSSYVENKIIKLDGPVNMNYIRYGALCNSFLTEANDEIEFAISFIDKNIILGKALTRYFFEKFSGEKHRLFSIVRGHQQINECARTINLQCNMLNDLIKSKGCVRQWDGSVYTLGDSGNLTGFQSFLVVSLREDVEKATVKHFYKNRRESDFIEETAILRAF